MVDLNLIEERISYLKRVFKDDAEVANNKERLKIYIKFTQQKVAELMQDVEDDDTLNILNGYLSDLLAFKMELNSIKEQDVNTYKTSNIKEQQNVNTYKAVESSERQQGNYTSSVSNKEVESSEGKWVARIFTILGALGIIGAGICLFYTTWSWMSDELKGIMVSLCGFILGGIGVGLTTRNNNKFNHCITSAGIALVYVAIGLSAIYLGTISSLVAVLLCVLVSLLVLFIAHKFDSQIIGTFAIIGGYLPILEIENIDVTLGYVIYLGVFNLLTTAFVMLKDWKVLTGVAYFLDWLIVGVVASAAYDWEPALGFGYCLFVFVLNTVIPLIACKLKNETLTLYSIVLIIANTLISSIMLFSCSLNLNNDYTGGITFSLLGIGYMIIGLFYNNILPTDERKFNEVFSVLGITLITIVVPMQLSIGWLCLVWLLESVLLASIGYFKNKNVYRIMASILFFITCFTHECHTVDDAPFFWQYHGFFFTGLLALLFSIAYIYFANRDTNIKGATKVFVDATITCMLLFGIYYASQFSSIINDMLEYAEPERVFTDYYTTLGYLNSEDSEFMLSRLINFISYAVIYAYMLGVYKFLDKKKFKLTSVSSIGIAVVTFFVVWITCLLRECSILHHSWSLFSNSSDPTYISASTYLLCVFAHLLLLFITTSITYSALNNLGVLINKDLKRVKALTITIIALLTIVFSLNQMYGIENTGVYTSLVCVLFGAMWVLKGFKINFKGMRYTGLAFASIFIIKILFDVNNLSDNIKPIIYVIVALSCFGIGWAYTYLSKKSKEV